MHPAAQAENARYVSAQTPGPGAFCTLPHKKFAKNALAPDQLRLASRFLLMREFQTAGQNAGAPATLSHSVPRRSFLKFSGATVLATTAAGLWPRRLMAQTQGAVNLGSGDIGVMNYAYALEQLEAAFYTKFDFTGGGKYRGVFSDYHTFLELSQTFEDTGVKAYKGQAANLITSHSLLTAAEVRRLRGVKAWTGAFDEPLSKAQVLNMVSPFIRKAAA
ncbi:MAG: ferritin-like domain-containing protein [Chthoniobacterales bacterium]|nr:ferritin-like domain-containing protein [Chthoniobacterales bacterium]